MINLELLNESEPIDLNVKKNTSGGVNDVQVNGTSIVKDGVADIPKATKGVAGVVKVETNTNRPVYIDSDGLLQIARVAGSDLDNRNQQKLISGAMYDHAVRKAMCDGKGQAWTDEEKASARNRLGLDLEPIVIDIETTEEVKIIDIVEYNGKPLSDYDFKQMWVFVESVGGGSGAGCETQIRINNYKANNCPYLSVATSWLNSATKSYWGGCLDIRNGLLINNNSVSTQPHYRANTQMGTNSYMLLFEKNINQITVQSISTNMPIGTKFKIILR